MFCLTVDPDIKLGLLEERHAGQLFAQVDANRDYLRNWLPWLDANTSVADTRNFIKGCLEQFAGGNGFQTGIFFQEQLVGMVGFHQIDWTNRRAELGYWLAEDFQRQGIITRTCRFLIEYAFQEFGLNKVEIRCASKNYRSCAIPRRLGFKQEGVIRQGEFLYDHMVDLVIYGLLASEWATQKS